MRRFYIIVFLLGSTTAYAQQGDSIGQRGYLIGDGPASSQSQPPTLKQMLDEIQARNVGDIAVLRNTIDGINKQNTDLQSEIVVQKKELSELRYEKEELKAQLDKRKP